MEAAKKSEFAEEKIPEGTRSDLDDPDATVPVETLDLDDEFQNDEDDRDTG